ncbi:hypothetical protein GF389_05170 [Candidatus Dojkabacteria bacterium]|nr:hypothetical protein [Candidatus Dojkabacteria bacterium]
MAMPNPSSIVRKQTETVSAQFDSEKLKAFAQIEKAADAQIREIESNADSSLGQIDGKLAELEGAKAQIDINHPQYNEIVKQIGMLREQKKQLRAQVKMAVAAVKTNAAREKENIRTRLEKQKQDAIGQTVNAVLKQYSLMMAQKKAEQEGAMNDELKAGNRG